MLLRLCMCVVTGTTGEGNSMTVEERKRVAEAWISAGRDRYTYDTV